MFNNALTMTVAGSAVTFSRKGTASPETLGVFKNADGTLKVEIRQKSTRARKRHEIVMTKTKYASDPLTSVNSEVSASLGLYFDEPKIGFSDDEATNLLGAIRDWINADTNFAQLLSDDT